MKLEARTGLGLEIRSETLCCVVKVIREVVVSWFKDTQLSSRMSDRWDEVDL